ncbi:hypothetical protein GJ697_23080 [Pseudoduganella sp. FT25W]|uniref:Uncharacterized protein n=1 Tax=Duganella alba TaxID=2666081 RepID=A0A6L5QP82_9BURK|nr:hypothetical protein [Duganella alba]MRX10721.1 hypothetical protein [Duganella alba]MRX18637.1 hypothetical protein [Duganella alba]
MKLISTSDYTVRLVTPPNDKTNPQCEVMLNGAPTGTIVDGAILEAALKWHEYTLLFLTDDIPFEDALRIYLLDEKFNVMDSAQIMWIYATGIFSHLDLSQPDAVSFRFFADLNWTLTLLPERAFALPIISDPLSVSRPFKFYRRFRISNKQSPDTD